MPEAPAETIPPLVVEGYENSYLQAVHKALQAAPPRIGAANELRSAEDLKANLRKTIDKTEVFDEKIKALRLLSELSGFLRQDHKEHTLDRMPDDELARFMMDVAIPTLEAYGVVCPLKPQAIKRLPRLQPTAGLDVCIECLRRPYGQKPREMTRHLCPTCYYNICRRRRLNQYPQVYSATERTASPQS